MKEKIWATNTSSWFVGPRSSHRLGSRSEKGHIITCQIFGYRLGQCVYTAGISVQDQGPSLQDPFKTVSQC